MRWWHWYVLRHNYTTARVTVPFFDPSARGVYIRCNCGKEWAL